MKSKGKGKGKLASHREKSVTCHMRTQFCFRVNGRDQLSNATNDQWLTMLLLLDWNFTSSKIEVVAKGRWNSNDSKVIVHHVCLGLHVVRVWVDLPKKLDAFSWRPNSKMTYIEDVDKRTIVQSPDITKTQQASTNNVWDMNNSLLNRFPSHN
uniref:Uncharacterized protein n=1 Tax=Cucumis melo TaxID=3656 RepID=A0A9I9EB58_CUCME